MTKTQKKYLIENIIKYDAKEIIDIPPHLWKYVGFDGENEDKINFLISIISKHNEKTRLDGVLRIHRRFL